MLQGMSHGHAQSAGDHAGIDVEAARLRRLADVPALGANMLLVSLLQSTGKREHWIYIALGESVVYRPNDKNSTAPASRISVEGCGAWIRAMQ